MRDGDPAALPRPIFGACLSWPNGRPIAELLSFQILCSVEQWSLSLLTAVTCEQSTCVDVDATCQLVIITIIRPHRSTTYVDAAHCYRGVQIPHAYGAIIRGKDIPGHARRHSAVSCTMQKWLSHSICHLAGWPQTWKTWTVRDFSEHEKLTEFCAISVKTDFALWVKPVSSNPYAAKCIWCTKTVDLSNMGRQALVSHISRS